jgi:hypothetical protein
MISSRPVVGVGGRQKVGKENLETWLRSKMRADPLRYGAVDSG